MPWLLVGILGVCSIVLIVAGLRQWARRRHLGRFAHECGLKFSWRDPFGLIQGYGACRLMQAGHSAHVDGVLFGRFGDWNVRMFDLGFEVGHGPNRSVRRYTMIAAELPHPVATSLVWRDGGDELSVALPTPAPRPIDQRWTFTDDATIAGAVRDAWGAEASESIGVETAERLVLFATADSLDGEGLLRQLVAAAACLAALTPLGQTDH